MPDELKCPRCGKPKVALVLIGMHEEHGVLPGGIGSRADRLFYRCNCGPLGVVEGDKVEWYYPPSEALGPLLDLVRGALLDETGMDTAIRAIDDYRRLHSEARP